MAKHEKSGMTARDIREKVHGDYQPHRMGEDIRFSEKWTSYLLKLEPRISMTKEKTKKAFYEVLGDKILSQYPHEAATYYEKAGFEDGLKKGADKFLEQGYPNYALRIFIETKDLEGIIRAGDGFVKNGMYRGGADTYKRALDSSENYDPQLVEKFINAQNLSNNKERSVKFYRHFLERSVLVGETYAAKRFGEELSKIFSEK